MAAASQSLFNMAVATDNAGGSQGLLMPKLQFRFRLNFINLGTTATSGLSLTKQVMDCNRPQPSFGEIPIHVYNSTLWIAGKHTWNEFTCKIRDDAAGSVAKSIGQQLQLQFDFVNQASAASANDYKFQLNLDMLDGGNGAYAPTVLETWEMYGCWIKSATYNQLSYSASEACDISLSIRYDNAVQTPLGEGVGTDVGRVANAATGLTTGIGALLGGG